MSFAIVFFVCIVAVAASFIDEWARLAEKLRRLPGTTLFLPLLILSWIVEVYANAIYWLLIHIQALLYQFSEMMARFFPIGTTLIRALLLFLLTISPLWWKWYQNRTDVIFHVSSLRLWITMLLWISLTIVLLFHEIIA